MAQSNCDSTAEETWEAFEYPENDQDSHAFCINHFHALYSVTNSRGFFMETRKEGVKKTHIT